MTNQLMLDASWKWLPKTAIFLNATQGFITYLDEPNAARRRRIRCGVTAGLRGLLTEKTSVVLALGYTNGFYSSGATTGGFLGSTFADLSFTVRPTMLSRVVLGYRHDFENSVISNFYYNETAYASYVQQIAGRLALDLSGRYVYRNYQGLSSTRRTAATRRTTSSRSARRSTTSCATGSTPASATRCSSTTATSQSPHGVRRTSTT